MGQETKQKILYIDDELHLMEGVIASLEIVYNVIRARTVDQALDILESKDKDAQPDLIVLDVRLPKSKRVDDPSKGRTMGLAFAEKLQKRGNQIPIIAYTVVHNQKTHEDLEQAGVKKVIMKTEPPSTLKREIKDLLLDPA